MDTVGPSGGPSLQLVSPGPCHTLSRSPSAGTGFPGRPERRLAGLQGSEARPGTQAAGFRGQEHGSGIGGTAFPALSANFPFLGRPRPAHLTVDGPRVLRDVLLHRAGPRTQTKVTPPSLTLRFVSRGGDHSRKCLLNEYQNGRHEGMNDSRFSPTRRLWFPGTL